MSKKYSGEKPDNNQPEIIRKLREIPGMVVYPGYNDLIIGYGKVTCWIELKNPEKCLKKDGGFTNDAFTDKQKKIDNEFTGCRIIATSYNQVIEGVASHFDMLRRTRCAKNLRRFKR